MRQRLALVGGEGGTGAAYNVSMNAMGYPIASNLRDAYMNLVKIGKQNEIPLFAGGGVGKNGNLAANAAALIMLGSSRVQVGKYIMQATAGCLGSEMDRCNVCNIGLCPKGITSQDPRLYRRLDPEKVAERLVDVYLSFDAELKKIVAPLGRFTDIGRTHSGSRGRGLSFTGSFCPRPAWHRGTAVESGK